MYPLSPLLSNVAVEATVNAIRKEKSIRSVVLTVWSINPR